MTQTSPAKEKRRPRPNNKTRSVKPAEAEALVEPAEASVEPAEASVEPAEAAEAAVEPAEAAESAVEPVAPAKKVSKPVVRHPQATRQDPAIVRLVVEKNELAKRICQLEPERTVLELFTSMSEAAVELDEDPVNVESAMRLLAGLGVCTFVVGRQKRPNRAIWHVGNIREVLEGASEYTKPRKTSPIAVRPLSAVAKISVTSSQRAAICTELGQENISRADLKKWAEELLQSAVEMLSIEEPNE